MEKKIMLIVNILVIALAVIAVALLVWIFVGDNVTADSSVIGACVTLSFIAIGIAVVTALIFPIIQAVENPKTAVLGLIALGGIVVLGLIAYLFAGNSLTPEQLNKYQITEGASILVSAGINLTYIIGGLAVIAAIFMTIKGSFSK